VKILSSAAVLALAMITVRPGVVTEGGDLVVTCRVQKHPDTRMLEAGIIDFTSSQRSLAGADAPVTHTFRFRSVPCGVGDAYCAIVRTGSRVTVTRAPFVVHGCWD
jgi:hypothetical protein